MPFVETWHSTQQRVFHCCTRCPEGKAIPPDRRYLGTGGKRPCLQCARLIRRGVC